MVNRPNVRDGRAQATERFNHSCSTTLPPPGLHTSALPASVWPPRNRLIICVQQLKPSPHRAIENRIIPFITLTSQ